ncbi:MAG: M16 family metallopeptidase, partial [Fimbriimonadales bacterium]
MSAGANPTPLRPGVPVASARMSNACTKVQTVKVALLALFLALSHALLAQPQRLVLSNGVQLVVERVPDAPLTALEVWIRAGVADETPATSGVAHLLEHLIFKGTADSSPDALDATFEQAGGILDASTERDWTRYSASVLPDQWQTPLRLLLRCLLQPALPPEALEKERRLILNDEYALHRADPIRPARYALFAKAFPSHPYGLPLLGDPETLARIDIETLRRFHQAHYRPERLVVVLVGAVEVETARRVVEEALNPLPLSPPAAWEPTNTPESQTNGISLPQPARGNEEEGFFSVLHDACLALGIPTPPAGDIDGWLCAEVVRIALAEPYLGLLYEGDSLPFGRLHSEYLPRAHGSLLAFYALPPVEPHEDWHAMTRERLGRALRRIAQGAVRPA